MVDTELKTCIKSSPKPVYSTGECILKQLNEWRVKGKYCDIALKVFNELYPAHACVLAAASPYLNCYLSECEPRKYSPAHPQIVEIHIETNTLNKDTLNDTLKTNYQTAMSTLLDFIYTSSFKDEYYNHYSQVSFNEECEFAMTHLKLIAKLLQIKPVVDFCNKFLAKAHEHKKAQVKEASVKAANALKESGFMNDLWKKPVVECTGIENIDIQFDANETVLEKDITTGETDQNTDDDGRKSLLHKCDFCDFKSTKYNVSRHQSIHNDGKYDCTQCDFETKAYKDFMQHLSEHTFDPLLCSKCGYKAKDGEDLLKHTDMHTGPLPFFCFQCDQRFISKSRLNLHIPVHSSGRPYKCVLCPATFKWKNSLKLHQVTHSKERNVLCDICGWRSNYKAELKAHYLTHTGNMFKCPVEGCRFQCKKRYVLKDHAMTHSKEKPYTCEVCGTSFSLSRNLKRHMKLHVSYRHFKCSFCDYTATRSDKLGDHLQNKHGLGKIKDEPLATSGHKELQPERQVLDVDVYELASSDIDMNNINTLSSNQIVISDPIDISNFDSVELVKFDNQTDQEQVHNMNALSSIRDLVSNMDQTSTQIVINCGDGTSQLLVTPVVEIVNVMESDT